MFFIKTEIFFKSLTTSINLAWINFPSKSYSHRDYTTLNEFCLICTRPCFFDLGAVTPKTIWKPGSAFIIFANGEINKVVAAQIEESNDRFFWTDGVFPKQSDSALWSGTQYRLGVTPPAVAPTIVPQTWTPAAYTWTPNTWVAGVYNWAPHIWTPGAFTWIPWNFTPGVFTWTPYVWTPYNSWTPNTWTGSSL